MVSNTGIRIWSEVHSAPTPGNISVPHQSPKMPDYAYEAEFLNGVIDSHGIFRMIRMVGE